MKKTVLIWGLRSGAVMATLMALTVPFSHQIGFGYAMAVGYTSMILAFLFIYPAITSYRDKIGNGRITFAKSLQVGLLVTLISSLCYVIAWLVISSLFMPHFMDEYSQHVIEQMRKSGASAADIQKQAGEMQHFAELYKNPFIKAAYTIMEPLPPGILVTLISASIVMFKQKKKSPVVKA